MARMGMIHFRCWYCNRKQSAGGDRIGERLLCGGCGERLRVPRYRDGPSRDKSLFEWFIEFVVYGGCALLGFGLGVLIVSQLRLRVMFPDSGFIVAGLTLAGLLIGGLFGERGASWIGSMIRSWENHD